MSFVDLWWDLVEARYGSGWRDRGGLEARLLSLLAPVRG